MPYKLKKKRNEPLYWVITIETGKKHSKDPIPKEKAKAQMRILKTALRGKGDEGEDDEMARLMEPEPVAFAPAPAANPFAGFFEPRMLRVRARRQARKRAISTVQGALMSNAEKRQKTSHGLRGGINKEKYIQIANSYAETLTARQLIKMYRDVVKVLTPEQIKLVRNQFGENFFEILEEILHDIETEFNKENYGRFKTIDGIEEYFIINAESKIRNFIAFIRKILFDNEDEKVSFPPQPSRDRSLRGGITLNEFDDLLQAYARKYSDYDDIKEKTEEDLQKMLKYTKKFFNILKSNLNTNQWNNPRLMQLIDSLDSLEKDQLRKLKNGEELKLDENGKYTEIVDLIHNTKMDDEKETDILANSSGRVGNPTRNPPKEFPPVPIKKGGKGKCRKCGLRR